MAPREARELELPWAPAPIPAPRPRREPAPGGVVLPGLPPFEIRDHLMTGSGGSDAPFPGPG
jgi:hypothetical protein